MKDLGKKIRSVFGTLLLAALAGCLILAMTGDWEGSVFYLDLTLLFTAVFVFVPMFLSRIDESNSVNKIFTLLSISLWTFTAFLPFVLIAMKQGRFVMIGVLVGVIIATVLLVRTQKDKTEKRKKIEGVMFPVILSFPFIYALLLWSDLRLMALFLVLAAVNVLFYLEMLLKSRIGLYVSKENWRPLSIQLPDLEPIVLSEGITSIGHFNHLELGYLKTRTYQLQFPLTYEVNGLHYKKEAFIYNWYAPFEDKLKNFNWETDLKGMYLNLIYDPEDPSNISLAMGEKEDIDQMIFNYKKRKKKYQIYALGVAGLGILLFIFKIAVT
jgi:hypothetical protein